MKIVSTIAQAKTFVQNMRQDNKSIGFVPTMGALHQGHMSLVQACQQDNDITVMSIYVNPTQFGPQEDLASYFRPIEQDTQMALDYGVDLLFLPSDQHMYAPQASTYVVERRISQLLCGKYRPGHFDGVCTIVLKLLNILTPHRLYLGLKDVQQFRIIENMARDLCLPVEVIGTKIIREKDGLACSSRNLYLSPELRLIAPILFQALSSTKALLESGETSAAQLITHTRKIIGQEKELGIQYIELLDWMDFTPIAQVQNTCVLALACFLGKTRLIDNIRLSP